jgi:pimeloyl-ACP methyl ester carboxylesterase
LAIDLPGLGADKTPLNEVTLASWNDSLCAVIDEQSEPVVLVGHSRGGLNISQAAESRPDKVCGLIYVAAFLLRNGESIVTRPDLTEDSTLASFIEVAADGHSSTVRPEGLREAFYADCGDQDLALARSCLLPEPAAPFATSLRLTDAAYGRVPRYYVECSEDRALSIGAQRRMLSESPCRRVATMTTSHSPFFSAAADLTQNLLDLVQE